MKKLRVGQVRELLGVKIAILHSWGDDCFAIAPLSRRYNRPDQWKTSNGLIIHCGLIASETISWLLDHSKLIGAISSRDLDACWYIFCDQIDGAHYHPTRITEDEINRKRIKEWPPETPQALAKAEKEWRNFMSVSSPLWD